MRQSHALNLLVLTVGLGLWTLAPYGGCSCNNPMGPASGPTPTPTPTQGPVVQSWDGVQSGTSAPGVVNNWRGQAALSVDNFGVSTYHGNIVSPGYTGAGNCLEFSGIFGRATPAGSCGTYPYVAHLEYLSPLGPGGQADVTAGGGLTGIRFYAKQASVPSNVMIVKLVLLTLSNYSAANPCASDAYAYHNFVVTPTTSWMQYTIPFTSFKLPSWDTSGPMATLYLGSNLTSAVCLQGGDLYLNRVEFDTQNPTTYPGQAPYDFYIDQLEFY